MLVICFCDCEFEVPGARGLCPRCGKEIECPTLGGEEAAEGTEIGLIVEGDSAEESITQFAARLCPTAMSGDSGDCVYDPPPDDRRFAGDASAPPGSRVLATAARTALMPKETRSEMSVMASARPGEVR